MSRCRYCDRDTPYRYVHSNDGRGLIKLHEWGIFPDTYDCSPCEAQTWFGRHPFFVGLAIIVLLFLAAGYWG